MKTDLLLEKFNEEAIDMSKVVGGGPIINGCSQDGGNSYVDYIGDDGVQYCNHQTSTTDPDGWCEDLL